MDVSKMQYSEDEMSEMGEAMLLVNAIHKEPKVHALVKKHLKSIGESIEEVSERHADLPTEDKEEDAEETEEEKPKKKITSIKDLRKRIAGED